jgi:hypothetical protein
MAEETKTRDTQAGDSVESAKSVPPQEKTITSEDEKKDASDPAKPAEKKSFATTLKGLWAKTGLSLPLLLVMAKCDSYQTARMFNMLIFVPGEVLLQQLPWPCAFFKTWL